MTGPNGKLQLPRTLPRHRPAVRVPTATLLDDDLAEIIGAMLEVNYDRKKVAKALGIPQTTFYGWLRKGKEAGAAPIFVKLLERVRLAKSRWEHDQISTIVQATKPVVETMVTTEEKVDRAGKPYTVTKTRTTTRPGDWRASAHLLERQIPEDWGRKDKLEHSGELSVVHALTRIAHEGLAGDKPAEISAPKE